MIKQASNLTSDQLEKIVTIWLHSNIEAHPFVPKEYWESNKEEVIQLLPQSELSFYESDNEILGFIGIMENYIAGIFVDSNHRSKKIGKQLLDNAKQRKEFLELSVYKENELAVNFYLREEFSVIQEGVDVETNNREYVMRWKKE